MRLLRILPILLFACAAQVVRAAEPRPLELGVVPYLPTPTLFAAYQPLRAHLEESLKRPVVLTTAPDFVTFLERCVRREYDAIVLGPGLGRFAQVEAGFQPLVVTRRNIKALVLVERHASHAGLKDLSGKRVAMLDPMTGISQLGTELLRTAGMQPERDYRIMAVKSPSNAVHAVLQGEAEAGVTTANLIPQLADDMKHRLRIIAESREIPGLMFMLRPTASLGAAQMQETLLHFAGTEAGRKFSEALAMDGLRIPAEREIRAMDGFLPEIRKHFRR